jgi:hypothetical protein
MSYYLWMIENYKNFDKIMHLDFRDIVIQKDPFEFMIGMYQVPKEIL